MFFMCMVMPGKKELHYNKMVICNSCGSYGRYQVFMSYMSFILFFIPVFRWNRHYYVQMSCCQTVYELNPEVGRQIARGMDVEIREQDLTLVQEGTGNPWNRKRTCPSCGTELENPDQFCPHCGQKLS